MSLNEMCEYPICFGKVVLIPKLDLTAEDLGVKMIWCVGTEDFPLMFFRMGVATWANLEFLTKLKSSWLFISLSTWATSPLTKLL